MKRVTQQRKLADAKIFDKGSVAYYRRSALTGSMIGSAIGLLVIFAGNGRFAFFGNLTSDGLRQGFTLLGYTMAFAILSVGLSRIRWRVIISWNTFLSNFKLGETKESIIAIFGKPSEEQSKTTGPLCTELLIYDIVIDRARALKIRDVGFIFHNNRLIHITEL